MATQATARPAYAATVYGSNGQVIARFRVKAIKASRPDYSAKLPKGATVEDYPMKAVVLPVLGLAATSTDSRPLFVTPFGNETVFTLIEKDGAQVWAGYVRGSGSIFQKKQIQVTRSGNAAQMVNTHSGQRQAQNARFAGLWCKGFEDHNEAIRRAR